MIDAFVQLLLAVGQVKSDVIGDLPTEVGSKILRYLDEESLVSCAGVNRRWNAICRGDPVLRRRIRRRLQKERRQRVQAYYNTAAGVEVTRRNPAAMFTQRNGTVTVRTKKVEYEVPARSAPLHMKKFKVKKDAKPKTTKSKKFIDQNNNVTRSLMRL